MPCCLVILVALMIPRLTILCLWLFTSWFKGIFESAIWPVLGFFFLPITLLWYTAVQNWYGGHWGGWQILGIIIAILLDISPGGHGARRRRRVVEKKESPL